METLTEIIKSGDMERQRRFIANRFDVPIERIEDRHLATVLRTTGDKSKRPLEDSYQLSIARNRLYDFGLLRLNRSGYFEDDATTAVMHVGFIFIEETEEMIERLKSREVSAQFAARVARSKLPATPLVVQPIDRVAQRVAEMRA